MNDDTFCPFSKPIIGQWCQCPHARQIDRRSGKMICVRADEHHESCVALATMFKEKSRFVLGLNLNDVELTHAQIMKIRCGGLLGMQRVLKLESDAPPSVLDVIAAAEKQYGDVAAFPFGEIVKDIQRFSHRKK